MTSSRDARGKTKVPNFEHQINRRCLACGFVSLLILSGCVSAIVQPRALPWVPDDLIDENTVYVKFSCRDRNTYLISAASKSIKAQPGPIYQYSKSAVDSRHVKPPQTNGRTSEAREINVRKTDAFLDKLGIECRSTEKACWASGGEHFDGEGDGPSGGDVNPYCLVHVGSPN